MYAQSGDAAHRTDALVYLLDIFPTLCALAGVEVPPSVEGRNLMPDMARNAAGGREALYLAYADSIRGVTDGRHKLIEYACGATQIFDLSRDPLEIEDLSGRDASAAVLGTLRQQLRRLAVAWDDERHPSGRSFWARRADLG